MHRFMVLLVPVMLVAPTACGGASQPPTPTAVVSKPAASAAPSAAPSLVAPAPSASPAASPGAAVPSPSAVNATTAPPSGQAAPTAEARPETMWIANTDGNGVYLRNSPHDGDRAGVLAEGTMVTITGEQEEGDGRQWYPVKTADDQQGYVPIMYLSRTAPQTTPTPSEGGEPK